MKRQIPWLHIVLFVLTFCSTLAVGAMHEGVNLLKNPAGIIRGLPFSFWLMVILLSHELSHYVASKKHGVEATLPYFIPAPTLFGTFGAVIRMKSPIATRNALMDIGASGPIAGFLVSLVAVVIGLFHSRVVQAPSGADMIVLGDSLLFKALARVIVGSVPDGYDVFLHPVAFAGWIGFFVTSLNLLPIGQLDGGHIVYALVGERHVVLSRFLIGVLIGLGVLLNASWLVWALLLLILGYRHPPIMYPSLPLDPVRRKIGWVSLAIFVLTFIPVPIAVS